MLIRRITVRGPGRRALLGGVEMIAHENSSRIVGMTDSRRIFFFSQGRTRFGIRLYTYW